MKCAMEQKLWVKPEGKDLEIKLYDFAPKTGWTLDENIKVRYVSQN